MLVIKIFTAFAIIVTYIAVPILFSYGVLGFKFNQWELYISPICFMLLIQITKPRQNTFDKI